MTTLSTHVLDAALGRPAAGLDLTLTRPDGTSTAGRTDDDGRAALEGELAPGMHILTFATGRWFDAQERATFYPEVVVAFSVASADAHHHVAVLLSPFAYTTYKGS